VASASGSGITYRAERLGCHAGAVCAPSRHARTNRGRLKRWVGATLLIIVPTLRFPTGCLPRLLDSLGAADVHGLRRLLFNRPGEAGQSTRCSRSALPSGFPLPLAAAGIQRAGIFAAMNGLRRRRPADWMLLGSDDWHQLLDVLERGHGSIRETDCKVHA